MWMSRNVEGEKVHGTWPGPQEQRIRVQLSEIQKVKRKPHFEKVKQSETMINNVHFEYFYVFLCISGTFSARTSANFQISAVELNSLSQWRGIAASDAAVARQMGHRLRCQSGHHVMMSFELIWCAFELHSYSNHFPIIFPICRAWTSLSLLPATCSALVLVKPRLKPSFFLAPCRGFASCFFRHPIFRPRNLRPYSKHLQACQMFSCMPTCHNGITGSCCNFPPKDSKSRSLNADRRPVNLRFLQGLQSDPSFAWCAEQPSSFDSRQSN